MRIASGWRPTPDARRRRRHRSAPPDRAIYGDGRSPGSRIERAPRLPRTWRPSGVRRALSAYSCGAAAALGVAARTAFPIHLPLGRTIAAWGSAGPDGCQMRCTPGRVRVGRAHRRGALRSRSDDFALAPERAEREHGETPTGVESEAVPATVSGERGRHRGPVSGSQPLEPRLWEGDGRAMTRKPGDRPARVALALAQGMVEARKPV